MMVSCCLLAQQHEHLNKELKSLWESEISTKYQMSQKDRCLVPDKSQLMCKQSCKDCDTIQAEHSVVGCTFALLFIDRPQGPPRCSEVADGCHLFVVHMCKRTTATCVQTTRKCIYPLPPRRSIQTVIRSVLGYLFFWSVVRSSLSLGPSTPPVFIPLHLNPVVPPPSLSLL